jgi:hypothetical protein
MLFDSIPLAPHMSANQTNSRIIVILPLVMIRRRRLRNSIATVPTSKNLEYSCDIWRLLARVGFEG